MKAQPLSPESEKRVEILFPPNQHDLVRSLLVEECGNNLPGLENADATAIDRFRFAVLKLADGDLSRLDQALQLAKTDWRDLLMAAGFGKSLTAHESWLPKNTADCAVSRKQEHPPKSVVSLPEGKDTIADMALGRKRLIRTRGMGKIKLGMSLCSKIAESIEALIRVGFHVSLEGSAAEIASDIQADYSDRLPSGDLSDAIVLETLVARGGVYNAWSFDTEEMEITNLLFYARQLACLAKETLRGCSFVEDNSRPVHLEVTVGEYHEIWDWHWGRDEPGCIFLDPLLNALTALSPVRQVNRVFGYIDHGQVYTAFFLPMKGARSLQKRIGHNVHIAVPVAGQNHLQTLGTPVSAAIAEIRPQPSASVGNSQVLLTELILYLLPLYPETPQVVDHVQLHLWEGGSEVTVEPAPPYPVRLGFGDPKVITGIRLTGAIDRNTIELCLRIPSLYRLPILACSESRFRSIHQALGVPVPFMAIVRQEDFDSATFAAYPEQYFLAGEWSRSLFLGSLDDFNYLVWLALPKGRFVVPCFRWRHCEEVPPDVRGRPIGKNHVRSQDIVKGHIYLFQITRAEWLTQLAISFPTMNEALVHVQRCGVQGRYILAECVGGVDMF